MRPDEASGYVHSIFEAEFILVAVSLDLDSVGCGVKHHDGGAGTHIEVSVGGDGVLAVAGNGQFSGAAPDLVAF